MSRIIGVTVGSSLPKPNFKQTDPTKGDYIKNKPDFDGLKSKTEQIDGIVSENVAKIDTLNELVGNTKVETQISDAVATLESEISNKADISYVNEKFDSIPEFDPTEIQEAIDTNTTNIVSNTDAIEEIKKSMDEKADTDHTHNDLQEQLEQKSQVQIITWEEND